MKQKMVNRLRDLNQVPNVKVVVSNSTIYVNHDQEYGPNMKLIWQGKYFYASYIIDDTVCKASYSLRSTLDVDNFVSAISDLINVRAKRKSYCYCAGNKKGIINRILDLNQVQNIKVEISETGSTIYVKHIREYVPDLKIIWQGKYFYVCYMFGGVKCKASYSLRNTHDASIFVGAITRLISLRAKRK